MERVINEIIDKRFTDMSHDSFKDLKRLTRIHMIGKKEGGLVNKAIDSAGNIISGFEL